MSQEISPHIEVVDEVAENEQHQSRTRRITHYVAGTLAVAALVGGGIKYFSHEDVPCESSIAIGDEAMSTVTELNLPSGDRVYLSVFTAPGAKKNSLPEVEVSVGSGLFGNDSALIETFGKPGPEASFRVKGNQNLLVDVTKKKITTSCIPIKN